MGIPRIGITCGEDLMEGKVFLTEYYHRCVHKAGGLPFLLPPVPERVSSYLENLDGLILAGGVDVDPFYFNEEPIEGMGEITPNRDSFEVKLTQVAVTANTPILAICRGVQVLTIALGGSIYQDIYSQLSRTIKHSQQAPRWYPTHSIQINESSLLDEVVGDNYMRVNSFHHQAVSTLAEGMDAIATSDDGIIEAVSMPKKRFVLGVQWHPECMAHRCPQQQEIFNAFVRACNYNL